MYVNVLVYVCIQTYENVNIGGSVYVCTIYIYIDVHIYCIHIYICTHTRKYACFGGRSEMAVVYIISPIPIMYKSASSTSRRQTDA